MTSVSGKDRPVSNDSPEHEGRAQMYAELGGGARSAEPFVPPAPVPARPGSRDPDERGERDEQRPRRLPARCQTIGTVQAMPLDWQFSRLLLAVVVAPSALCSCSEARRYHRHQTVVATNAIDRQRALTRENNAARSTCAR